MKDNLINFLPKTHGQYRENVTLANTTWFRVGGPAEIIFKPENSEDLSNFLINVDKNIPINILGLCSNVIIRDKGVKGIVIKLGRTFTDINIEKDIVSIGAACTDYNVAHFLADNGISGLEFLVGVPGSMGGAIAMNAGCYGSEISDNLIYVEAINKKTGRVQILSKSELGFKYRNCALKNDFIFTKAIFKLKIEKNIDIINNNLLEITKNRNISQPVKERTGGSTFKNPPNKKAWELIEEAGLRGFKLGGAQVSEKHCNFLINTGNATALDIENLGEFIRQEVLKKSGIELEWEIIRIGIK